MEHNDSDEPQVETPTNASIHRFFGYNNSRDSMMLFLGVLGAIIAGLLIPSISVIMGTIAGTFGDGKLDPAKMSEVISATTKYVGGVAAGIFFFGYVFFSFWQHLAENLTLKLRIKYLQALLKQEVGYFE